MTSRDGSGLISPSALLGAFSKTSVARCTLWEPRHCSLLTSSNGQSLSRRAPNQTPARAADMNRPFVLLSYDIMHDASRKTRCPGRAVPDCSPRRSSTQLT